MAKGKGRKGTRKAADMKIADTVEKNLDLKKAETLFDELSHVAGDCFTLQPATLKVATHPVLLTRLRPGSKFQGSPKPYCQYCWPRRFSSSLN
jgi:hypothetical protein